MRCIYILHTSERRKKKEIYIYIYWRGYICCIYTRTWTLQDLSHMVARRRRGLGPCKDPKYLFDEPFLCPVAQVCVNPSVPQYLANNPFIAHIVSLNVILPQRRRKKKTRCIIIMFAVKKKGEAGCEPNPFGLWLYTVTSTCDVIFTVLPGSRGWKEYPFSINQKTNRSIQGV